MLLSGNDAKLQQAPDLHLIVMIYYVVFNYTKLKYFLDTPNRECSTVFLICSNFCDKVIFILSYFFYNTKISISPIVMICHRLYVIGYLFLPLLREDS